MLVFSSLGVPHPSALSCSRYRKPLFTRESHPRYMLQLKFIWFIEIKMIFSCFSLTLFKVTLNSALLHRLPDDIPHHTPNLLRGCNGVDLHNLFGNSLCRLCGGFCIGAGHMLPAPDMLRRGINGN